MKHAVALALGLALAAAPIAAQEAETPEPSPFSEGFDLFSEGSRLMLEGLMDEMRPMMDQIGPLIEEEMLPFLRSLGDAMGDITWYETPERLPNGDIIIRRRDDAPPLEDPLPEGEIEL